MKKKRALFAEVAFLTMAGLISVGVIFAKQILPKNNIPLLTPIFNVAAEGIAETVWLPAQVEIASGKKWEPTVTATSAFFVDEQTGQVLFKKNEHQKLPIASVTKIMTSIITLEHKKMADRVRISESAASTEPDKMYLKSGEYLTIEELLDGVFLVSANDAAEALAEEVLRDRAKFIALMNQKAKMIAMNETLFVNPSGLEEDDSAANQSSGKRGYSSAYDVILMARYAINKWPQLLEITSQPAITIPQTKDHQDYELISGINLVTTYKGVLGFKTGYTPEAGLCLVTYAQREGKKVLGVILGATDRRGDARTLLDYSFKKLGVNN